MTFSSHRYMMLHDGTCVGVELREKQVLYMILSSAGDFVHISLDDEVNIHMTQYIPSLIRPSVLKLLRFRNMFISNVLSDDDMSHVFCTQETHDAASTVINTTTWSSTSVCSRDGWTCVSDITNSSKLRLCPYHRVLCYTGPMLFTDNTRVRDTPKPINTYTTQVSLVYSYLCAPASLKELFTSLVSSADASTASLLTIPIVKCRAPKMIPPTHEFSAISPELYLCRNSEYYITSYRTVIENLDDTIFATFDNISAETWLQLPCIRDTSSNFNVLEMRQDNVSCYLPDTAPVCRKYHLSLLSDTATVETIADLKPNHQTFLHLLLLYNHLKQRRCSTTSANSPEPASNVIYTPLCRDSSEGRFNLLANGVARACFKNRLLLEFSPLTNLVRALLPDGVELALPLSYYYDTILSSTCVTTSNTTMSMRDVATYVMQLMSFYRYATAGTPPAPVHISYHDIAMLVRLSDMRSDYFLQSCQALSTRSKPMPARNTTPGDNKVPITAVPNISPVDRRITAQSGAFHITKLNVLAPI